MQHRTRALNIRGVANGRATAVVAAVLLAAACKGGEVKDYYSGVSDGGMTTGGTQSEGGSSGEGGTAAGGDTGGGSDGTGGISTGGAGGSGPTGGEAAGGAAAAVRPFEDGCGQDTDCGAGEKCVLGLCVKPPPNNFKANFACDDILREGSDPDFSCWDTPQVLDTTGPDTVAMRGRIEFFGDGNVTKDLTVKVYDFATFDPTPCLTAGDNAQDVDRARAATEACIDEHNTALAEAVSHLCADNPSEGCYEMTGVPTRTELVIRVFGEARLWVPTYEYGVFVNPCVLAQFKDDSVCPEQRPEAAPDTNWSCSLKDEGGDVYFPNDLNVLSKTTWTTFPPTAGVPRIELGRGAIAGRAYDCQGRPVVNAAAGFFHGGSRTTYFNGNPDDTLPQPGLDRTNIDATYANLNTPAGVQGVVQVAWQGEGADRKLKVVNFNRLFLLPNTLIILSPSGRNPADVFPPYL